MKLPTTFWIAVGLMGFVSAAWADGGMLRAQQRAGDYVMTVFTSPTPLRAGPVDISILVQHAETGVALAEQPILIRVGNSGNTMVAEATSAAASNKLMQSATLELPSAGPWTIGASGAINGQLIAVEFAAIAEPPLPPWLAFWRLLLLPPAAIGVFIVHRLLVARSAR